jgi:hypothetical protein
VWVEIAEQSHLVFEPISHSFTTFTEYTGPLDVWFLLGDAVRTDTFSFWPFLVESGDVHGMFSVGSEEVPVGVGENRSGQRCACALCVCVCVRMLRCSSTVHKAEYCQVPTRMLGREC